MRNLAAIFAFAIACVVLTPAVSSAATVTSATAMNRCDSLHINTLDMSDEEIAEVCGLDSARLATGPSLQELNEENPSYIKREYNHKQQVIVGSVVMLCVAVAMVLMNNYNPSR